MKKSILLVEPNFPYPNRSKNRANEIHKNFAPIGLLKLGAYHKSIGNQVKLVRGNLTLPELKDFFPHEILITSLFTYWSKYVWDSVEHYRNIFPDTIIKLGGIYVTLHSNTPEFIKHAKKFKVIIHIGIHKEAEKLLPDYSLLQGKIDHHITHAMRGCIRRCDFCGTWKIEPELKYKTSEQLIKEIKEAKKNKIIFFDNNFFANPNIKQILADLAEVRVNNRFVSFESQSGFDGRLLEKDSELAILLKKARFTEVRIAWDNGLNDRESIKKQIKHLTKAGFPVKEIYVFMIYNFNIPYEDMLKKIDYCKKWGVQIVDCRYRPLSSTFDNYKSSKFREGQTSEDYYIHKSKGWTDAKIRDFRKRVRQHNMEIRYAKNKKYNKNMEKWSAIHHTYKFFKLGRPPLLDKIEKSPRTKDRITKLNRLKNYFKKSGIMPMDLSKYNKRELDDKINLLHEQYLK